MSDALQRLSTVLIERYRLEGELGQGGMATVYLAEDLRHRRKVALKVLRPELGAVIGAERFLHEIKTTANLQHPHILPLFDSGEAEGQLFYVMPYVAGATLRHRLDTERQLPLEEALGIARAVASALDYAHRQGIVHRDVKPENVLLSDGVPMVADFGVARAVSTAGGDRVTQPGLAVGTPAYMSPEQAAGDPDLDGRCDVYALGCLLYEMLAGELPYPGPTAQAIVAKLFKDPVPSVRKLREGVPAGVDSAIRRAMGKAPAERFASAAEFAAALATDPARAAVSPESLTEFTTRTRTPLIGRRKELSELNQRLERMTQGEGSFVVLGGEPGVGKTRLAEAVLQEARKRGYLCLIGHCYEMEGAPPYLPFVEQLEVAGRMVPAPAFRAALGEGAGEIARIMPGLRQTFPDIPPPLELPADQQRHYLFSRYREFAERACQRQPIVVLFDDLHWADESSLLLLEHFAQHVAGMPLLVLGTYRDVELDVQRPFAKCLERLTRQRLAERIALRRLPEEEVRDLLASLGGSPPPGRLVQAIYHETEGNPFFVEEVFQHLREEGRLFDAAGAWRTDLDLSELDVPEGVRLVIGRRLERVSEATRALLTTAAVIGPRFDLEVLEAVGDAGSDAILDALEEAEASGLVLTRSSGRDARYAFAHELIRATLVGGLSLPRRQRKHARIAEAMVQVYAKRLEQHATDLAYHLYQAGAASDTSETLRFIVMAAELALSAAAFDEALAQAERGFSLEEGLSEAQRARLLYIRGAALRGLGHWVEARDPWVAAFAHFDRLGDREAMVRLSGDLCYLLAWLDDSEGVFDYAVRGLAAAGPGASADHVLLLGYRAFGTAMRREPEAAFANARQALQMAESLGDRRAIAAARGNLALISWMHGEIAKVIALAGEAAAMRRSLGDRWEVSILGWMTQRCLLYAGRLEEAAALNDEQSWAAEELGNVGAWLIVDLCRGLSDWWRSGGLSQYEAFAHHVTETWGRAGPWNALGVAFLSIVRLFQGDPEASASLLERPPAELQSPMWVDLFWSTRFRAKAYAGHADALSCFEQHRHLLPQAGRPAFTGAWHALVFCIEGLAVLGERERTAALYPAAQQMIEQDFLTTDSSLNETHAGIAAAAGGQWEKAEQHFAGALRLADALPHHIGQAESRRWHGWMLLERGATGDAERARVLLAEAIAGYRRIGMPMHVAICEALLAKTEASTGSARVERGGAA